MNKAFSLLFIYLFIYFACLKEALGIKPRACICWASTLYPPQCQVCFSSQKEGGSRLLPYKAPQPAMFPNITPCSFLP